jgi:hypothetical protein
MLGCDVPLSQPERVKERLDGSWIWMRRPVVTDPQPRERLADARAKIPGQLWRTVVGLSRHLLCNVPPDSRTRFRSPVPSVTEPAHGGLIDRLVRL